jgi:maltooligosyltrehalose trehalohydrolase
MAEEAGPLPWERPLGAHPQEDGTTLFRVWAPRARTVEVDLPGGRTALGAAGRGVFEGVLPAVAGDDYRYVLDGGDPLPDPCSRFQPEGVRGPSRVVDTGRFAWTDSAWAGLDHDGLVIYEIHVGTFTPEGTLGAAAARLGQLRELGVTAVELMPLATFPGERNWGYDGLYTWAPHPAYGGPEALAAFVDAAHAHGIAVIHDVVYNHVGPGAEALDAFGPYFTDRHGTPWGRAMNFDDADCGGVREWAFQNARMWLSEYHMDGLRLDAVHAIYDMGARHLLAELADRARDASPRPVLLIAESDLNDPRILRPEEIGGYGIGAQWCDDFHHSLHALLTGERDGYYGDFGSVEDLATATRRPFVYDGRYSGFRRRRHGAPADDRPVTQFVVYSQNHDQVGNRAAGDRPPPGVRALAAAWVILSPYVPMIFMGEEDGSDTPFQFFTDHIDPAIARATRDGRRAEFAAFEGFDGEVPDPQSPETFARSTLRPGDGEPTMRDLYRRLLELRRDLPPEAPEVEFDEDAAWIAMRRGALRVLGNFGDHDAEVPVEARELVLATDPGAELRDGRVRLPARSAAVAR